MSGSKLDLAKQEDQLSHGRARSWSRHTRGEQGPPYDGQGDVAVKQDHDEQHNDGGFLDQALRMWAEADLSCRHAILEKAIGASTTSDPSHVLVFKPSSTPVPMAVL